MSGIIFNGQEMKKGENMEDYINRVVNETVNKTMFNNEMKNNLKQPFIKPNNSYTLLSEKNGRRVYKSLDVSDNDDSTDDETDDSTDDESEHYEHGGYSLQYMERVFRDFKNNIQNYKHTYIKNCKEYEYIMNHYFIKSRSYIHREKKSIKDYKTNDIFYFKTNDNLYLYNMWQITKDDEKYIYAKRLKPYNILRHSNEYTKNDINIYMYEYNNFDDENFKEMKFLKSESRIIINMYNICHLFYKVIGIPKRLYI